MTIEIEETLRMKANEKRLDLLDLAHVSLRDVKQFVDVSDEINFHIKDSNMPLTNWVRKTGNLVEINISSFNLDPTIQRCDESGRIISKFTDEETRDQKCRHVISHEMMEPLNSTIPFMEQFAHNTLRKQFDTGANEEGVVHSAQLTCSDVTMDSKLTQIKEQAIGFATIHWPCYTLDRDDIRRNNILTNAGLFAKNNPFTFSLMFLSMSRRSVVAGKIRKLNKNGMGLSYGILGVYRDQFSRFISSLRNEDAIKVARGVQDELNSDSPNWRSVKSKIDSVINKVNS